MTDHISPRLESERRITDAYKVCPTSHGRFRQTTKNENFNYFIIFKRQKQFICELK